MIACASAVARTAPLLSTRGASIHNACERIYRFRLPTPALPAKRFPMLRTSVCKPSTDAVSAEGIRSNQRANAKRRLFYT